MLKRFFLFVMMFTVYACAQVGQPQISAQQPTFDFGDVHTGEIVKHKFTIVNNGTDLLKISQVVSSCGCTAVQPEKNELKPSESTTILAEFNTVGRLGPQIKYITVISNDPATPQLQLLLKGNVTDIKKDTVTPPKIKFESTQHDFGKIKEGKISQYTFKFTNLGKETLVVSNVQTSCGCTAAVVQGKELKPAESGSIQIEFDSTGRLGRNSKTIVVMSNDPVNPVTTLTIYAEVEPRPEK
ncbi:MAG: DUF1573 domain-containing protein [Ignavibacteriaceae bacterium]